MRTKRWNPKMSQQTKKPTKKRFTDKQRKELAALMGSIGGQSGTGKSKVRSPEALQRAVRARVEANKKRKQQKALAGTA